MRPRILLLDEPHPKAKAIMEEVAECITMYSNYIPDIVYTQLTPYKPNKFNVNIPVFCPCTGVEHIQAPKIIHLDETWKANEGREITSTAEHTWSLILQLAKMNRVQLKNKTLGIIGIGRIGSIVACYAQTFYMNVIQCDKYPNGKSVEFALKLILEESDIITLHVPLNEETRGMIGKEQFDMMKPGALLVNTSRAEVVDEQALKDWIYKHKGNYADDFSGTYDIPSYYEGNKGGKAIRTPHIGGNCLEAREATDIYIAEKIKEYINGNL